jgi:hypothetical protein
MRHYRPHSSTFHFSGYAESQKTQTKSSSRTMLSCRQDGQREPLASL